MEIQSELKHWGPGDRADGLPPPAGALQPHGGKTAVWGLLHDISFFGGYGHRTSSSFISSKLEENDQVLKIYGTLSVEVPHIIFPASLPSKHAMF